MIKQVKINGKILIFEEWKENSLYPSDMARGTVDGDYIRLLKSYVGEYLWQIVFQGPNARYLEYIYLEMYSIWQEFPENQLEEAKQHIDKFLDQVNSLVAFL